MFILYVLTITTFGTPSADKMVVPDQAACLKQSTELNSHIFYGGRFYAMCYPASEEK